MWRDSSYKQNYRTKPLVSIEQMMYSVLDFYVNQCWTPAHYHMLDQFVSLNEDCYFKPHYLQLVICNPAAVVASHVTRTSLFKDLFGRKELTKLELLVMPWMLQSKMQADILSVLIKYDKKGWLTKQHFPTNEAWTPTGTYGTISPMNQHRLLWPSRQD